MPKPTHPRFERYQIFLVSLWQERSTSMDLRHAWRIRLENPRTGEQVGFTEMLELVDYLENWMDQKTEEEVPLE